MFRIPRRRGNRHTAPDHRPMLPEFRIPADPATEAVREVRLRRAENLPGSNQKWR